MDANNPMRDMDPQKIAHYETENYVAYYQRDWLKLLRASVGMVKETFRVSLRQALYLAYLMARAEIAFAPYPNNNVPLAEEYARRFYAYIKQVHHLKLDEDAVARVEVHWWSVHRKLFGNPDNDELIDALTELYALAYDVPRERVKEAAAHRAQGMLYSDYWVNQGKVSNSPLLAQEEEELCISYTALRAALST